MTSGDGYAYIPADQRALNEAVPIPGLAYDVWGRDVSADEAARLRRDPNGAAVLTPARGAVAIDETTPRLGKESFYAETFGDEFFLSDVVGMLDGPSRSRTPRVIRRAATRCRASSD